MSERTITRQVKKLLDSYPNDTLWYYKASDRFTSGVPDFIVCFKGLFIGIELKDLGKKARKLQHYTISRILQGGGIAVCTDTIEDIKRLFNELDDEYIEY